jgi:hypothetical protein
VIAGLHDVDAERRAGVALDTITTTWQQWQRQNRPPKALTAREALAALEFEALLVCTAAASLRNGVELTDADFERLTLAYRRIDTIASEVLA